MLYKVGIFNVLQSLQENTSLVNKVTCRQSETSLNRPQHWCVPSFEFRKIFNNIYFTENLRTSILPLSKIIPSKIMAASSEMKSLLCFFLIYCALRSCSYENSFPVVFPLYQEKDIISSRSYTKYFPAWARFILTGC